MATGAVAKVPVRAQKQDSWAEFEVLVSPAAAGATAHPVTVVRSPWGPASGLLTLNLQDPSFQAAVTLAATPEAEERDRRALGQALHDLLFQGEVGAALTASRLWMESGNAKGLRVRLWINDPALATLPWELLWARGQYLATVADLALVRYLPVPEPPPLQPQETLRILVVFQSPEGATVDPQELARLEAVLAGFGERIEVRTLHSPPVGVIQQALQEEPPFQVVHYLGHGKEGKLFVADDQGRRRGLEDQDYAVLFGGRRVPLVVLNACGSGAVDTDDDQDGGTYGLFSGVAPALIRQRVTAVVAMQYPFVEVTAAASFNETFYRALLNGKPVDQAVTEARNRLAGDRGLADRAWSTPVVYLGTKSADVLSLLMEGEDPLEHSRQVVRERLDRAPEARKAFEDVTSRLDAIRGVVRNLSAARLLLERLQAVRHGFEASRGPLSRAREDATARTAAGQTWRAEMEKPLADLKATVAPALSNEQRAIDKGQKAIAKHLKEQNFGKLDGAVQEMSDDLAALEAGGRREFEQLLAELGRLANGDHSGQP